MEKPSRLQKAVQKAAGPRVALLLPAIFSVAFVGVFVVVALQSVAQLNEVKTVIKSVRRANAILIGQKIPELARQRMAEVTPTMMPGATGCPARTPWPYRNSTSLFVDACCSDDRSCYGGRLDPTKEKDCCYGSSAPMPVTFRYALPAGGEEQCDEFDWWQVLKGKHGPLWQAMKDVAQILSQADADALAKAGHNRSRITWSGKDEKLDGADVGQARQYVGSHWGKSGWRQFQAIKRFAGLEPGHQFLELGCGALNAGQFFIPHLKKGSYVCVEPNEVLHKQSIQDHPWLASNISQKSPLFIARDDFDPRPSAGKERLFDRSWSHSVLSHAADWQLMQYFEVMAAVLKPGGVGMASIRFSDKHGRAERPSHDTSWIYPGVSYFSFREAACMAERAGLELELVPQARLFITEVCPNEFHDWIRMRRI